MKSTLVALLACLSLTSARKADQKTALSNQCREIKSTGTGTCSYCNHESTPYGCKWSDFWDPCIDKANPNPCGTNELLVLDGRVWKDIFDGRCKKSCPKQDSYCYATVQTYTDKCCACPAEYRPSVPGGHCLAKRGSGVAVMCVGCDGKGEVLVGDDQVGWQCIAPAASSTMKTSSRTPTPTPKVATPTPTPSPATCTAGAKLTQAEAAKRLAAAGITWASSKQPPCSDKTNKDCTSLDGIRCSAVAGAIALKAACKCDLIVTAGTETGHKDTGTNTHANGFKLDFRKLDGINNFVKKTYTPIKSRTNGDPQWVDASGNVFCDELSAKNPHWDVMFL